MSLLAVKVLAKGNQRSVGIAFADFVAKKFGVSEFDDNELFNNLEFVLVQQNVKEALVCCGNRESFESSKIGSIVQEAGAKVIHVNSKDFKTGIVEQEWGRIVDENSLKILSHIDDKICKDSVSLIINYLLSTNDLMESEKFEIYRYNLSQYMKLDIPALKALSLFPSASSESSVCLYNLLNRCKTPIGSRLLTQWIKQPLLDQNEIEKRHTLVEAFCKSIETMRIIQDFLKSFPDIYKLSRKFEKKDATLEEVVRVYQTVVKIPNIIDAFERIEDDKYMSLIEESYLSKLKELYGIFNKYIELVETTINFESMNNNECVVKSEFDESLRRLSDQLDELKNKIQEEYIRVSEDLEQDALKKLKLEQSEIYGWCLRITRSQSHYIKSKDYIELSVLKSGIYFTTLTMRKLSNKYNDIMNQYKNQQKHLVKEIVEIAASFSPVMEKLGLVISQLDVIISFSDISISSIIPYVRPIMSKKNKIILKDSRHPCLEIQSDITFISNDVNLERGVSEFLIITGPNMGGKSTYIRQIGLIVLMAQIGCFVPCAEAEISIFDSILARVGANDSQLKGISTFMAEMLETATILQTASSNSLIIIDELGRGTSTTDGFGLAWAISEYIISKINAFSLFATHFHELTELSKKYSIVKNLNVIFHLENDNKNKDLTLLYQVKPGICDQSFGIHVAKMINVY